MYEKKHEDLLKLFDEYEILKGGEVDLYDVEFRNSVTQEIDAEMKRNLQTMTG